VRLGATLAALCVVISNDRKHRHETKPIHHPVKEDYGVNRKTIIRLGGRMTHRDC
jgi:hypothetical protein